MRPKLYDSVALTVDLPEWGLCRGDLATLVDFVPHPAGGDEGAVLEICSALGETVAVVAVPLSHVSAVGPADRLAIRHASKPGETRSAV